MSKDSLKNTNSTKLALTEQLPHETDDFINEPDLTPPVIVAELNKHIIAQDKAKRSVAIALRNRYRRRLVPKALQDEIYPKNILMIGNTGVGKTEIARRLAKLAKAPFIKVEATKFSQIGYVGRNVESIIRDLMNNAVIEERTLMRQTIESKAQKEVTEIILDILLPESAAALNRKQEKPAPSPLDTLSMSFAMHPPSSSATDNSSAKPNNSTLTGSSNPTAELNNSSAQRHESFIKTRAKLKKSLLAGELEEKVIEIMLTPTDPSAPPTGINISGMNLGDNQIDALGGMMKNLGNMFRPKKSKQAITIKDARPRLLEEVAESMLDMNRVIARAKVKTETMGIVFIDEIDKIVSKTNETHGNLDISREGVQRDILPLVEGSSVPTSYGMIKTDHVLFIAAGAFHISSPADMIPELQGRFPIRVKLNPLKAAELKAILIQPKNALIKQYQALLKTEGILLKFNSDAINEIARTAEWINSESENIGARRLATLMEKLLEEYLFSSNSTTKKLVATSITIDKAYVTQCFKDILPDKDLSRYIL
ncbi:ATP-dependent protease ATP-binding subunit HslU [Spirochaetota bacterium]|nr:ATP-dependent protease ATP-binding subunit HslU [Spirochaetota bacterium]